jgi:hypothetical protein
MPPEAWDVKEVARLEVGSQQRRAAEADVAPEIRCLCIDGL